MRENVAQERKDVSSVLITDSYIWKRILISIAMIICVGIGYYGQSSDPDRLTWIGQIGNYFNMAVFPLFALYGYFWWKGRQERKQKEAALRGELDNKSEQVK